MLAFDVLEEAGFEAVEAWDADEALGQRETVGGIRILLIDVDMPRSIDGLKLAAAVRNRCPPFCLLGLKARFVNVIKESVERCADDMEFFDRLHHRTST